MDENIDQEPTREFKVKSERKLKSWSKFIAVFLIATSGVLGSLGLVDNLNTREVIEEPIMDEPFQMTFSEEMEDRFTRSFLDISSFFYGKIETRMVLSLINLEFERTPTSYLSFILLHKKTVEVLENITLSIELLFQLEEVGGGISLEAGGDPGELELWLTESGEAIDGMLEFHLFVYARIFSPSIEYLGPVLSLFLVGITLFRYGYTNCFIDRVAFIICGLGGMPLGALLVRHIISLYSFFYLPYLLAMILSFLVCLAFVLKSCSLNLSSASNTSRSHSG
ncbi:MAG: hypothetical protein ACE5I5_19285 [Candidatus Heimdallarchaeota archaeon]